MMNKKNKQKNIGFTLVETMVAIAILMLAILGPMEIASSGLRDSMFARDQATAYYLAQEGIEYVRYVRDYNFLKKSPAPDGWLTSLIGCINTTCTIDPVGFFSAASNIGGPITPTPCGGSYSACAPLTLVTTSPAGYTDYYAQGNGATGNVSIFTRTIKIVPINGTYDKEVQIQSTVTFQSHSRTTKTFTITENLRNLYQ